MASMPGLEASRLLKWASPDEREFVGHAYSEEHRTELTHDVTAERRAFLHRALTAEVLRREGVMSEMDDLLADKTEMSFADIPLTNTLTKEQHLEFALSDEFNYTFTEAVSYWTNQINWYSTVCGFRPTATKNDNYFYGGTDRYRYPTPELLKKAERIFEDAHDHSVAIVEAGYKLRFLMDGAVYIYNASLDFGGVEADIERFYDNPDENRHFAAPIVHWEAIAKMKKCFDKANKLKTFADVVTNLGEGLYVAPYYPAELKYTGRYVSFDDVRRFTIQAGLNNQTVASKTFHTLVRLACQDEVTRTEIEQQYFEPSPPRQRSGILFIDRAVLPKLYDLLASQRGAKSSSSVMLDITGELLEAHGPDKDITDLVYSYR